MSELSNREVIENYVECKIFTCLTAVLAFGDESTLTMACVCVLSLHSFIL